MIPPTMTGMSPAPASRRPSSTSGPVPCANRQDRDADEVDVLGDRRRDDLGRCQADPLVDDLEAGVPGPHGDLLGAVGVTVEPRLADEEPQRLAQLFTQGAHLLADGGELRAGGTAGESHRPGTPVGPELAETSRSARPLPVSPRAGALERGLHEVLVLRRPAQSLSAGAPGRAAPVRVTRLARPARPARRSLDGGIDRRIACRVGVTGWARWSGSG